MWKKKGAPPARGAMGVRCRQCGAMQPVPACYRNQIIKCSTCKEPMAAIQYKVPIAPLVRRKPVLEQPHTKYPGQSLQVIGGLLLCLGIFGGIAALEMSTTVTVPGGNIGTRKYPIVVPETEVYNIGLLSKRRIHLAGAGICVILGGIFIGCGCVCGAQPLK